jgi:hypothetical protein
MSRGSVLTCTNISRSANLAMPRGIWCGIAPPPLLLLPRMVRGGTTISSIRPICWTTRVRTFGDAWVVHYYRPEKPQAG